jgi:hypothetical protein
MPAFPTLNDDEIARIQAEEVARDTVRKKLFDARKASGPFDAWEFINSHFGLWLLTAVFVTGLGSAYKIFDERKKAELQIAVEKRMAESARDARMDRLSMEFSYRLSSALIALQEAHALIQGQSKQDRNEMRIRALSSMLRPSTDHYPPLFPEFSNYSGMALVAEIRTLANATEAINIKSRLARLSGLLNDPFAVDLKDPHAFHLLAGELTEAARYPRWENGFYYTDCSKLKPFC